MNGQVNSVAELELQRDQLMAEKAEKEVASSIASAEKQNAVKADRVEAAAKAAEARSAVTKVNAELKRLEKALAKAQTAAEKQAKIEAKAAAAAERAEARRIQAELAQSNPLMGFEVNYSALGAWVAERAKGRACYVEGAGWGEWTGTHWQFSRKPSAGLLDRVRRLYAMETGEVADKLNSNAKSAENILAHAEGAMTLTREVFNAPTVAHLVAFQNVTVNLKTGKSMPHDPEHYMTGCLSCDYDESADLDRILRTFARFWPNDTETQDMFQTALGYSATGEVAAKRSFFMPGNQEDASKNGDNGKSLVQDALVQLFGMGRGGWGTSVKPGIILDTGDRDANSHDGAKTPVIWKRFAMSSEPRKGSTVESGEFNRFSGGDSQPIRAPYGDTAIQTVIYAKLWMSLNDMPRFKSFNHATKIRLTPFPFNETFYDPGKAPEGCQEKELGLKEWMASEEGQKALGLYVVRGAMKYYDCNGGKAGNFPDSPLVAATREKLMATANPFNEMFEDWLVFDERADITETAMHKLLREFLGGVQKEWHKPVFVEALSGQGVVQKKVKGDRYYRGVRLSEKGQRIADMLGHKHCVYMRKAEHLSVVAGE
ncbi:hypothetical protein [Sagittula sp. MA-2]|jgi:phage/plasmid-associated DNA primase|uniref:hypothetical protein n=1 Tax=Sagittula sp. MA-2 TaxID=3048007 RepID=UPI0024C21466|nr:hypothetical protein [Sagittula sp. MA-2]WHZ36515.1 hypothetical protein QNI11_05755 [Sagittula sp. MA-2]